MSCAREDDYLDASSPLCCPRQHRIASALVVSRIATVAWPTLPGERVTNRVDGGRPRRGRAADRADFADLLVGKQRVLGKERVSWDEENPRHPRDPRLGLSPRSRRARTPAATCEIENWPRRAAE